MFLDKIPQVQALEVTLGLPDDVTDQDLLAVQNTLKTGLEKANKQVKD